MVGCPQLGVGIAVLTNSDDHQLQNDLAVSILADVVGEPGVYRDRLLALSSRSGAVDPDMLFEPPAGLASLVAKAAMPAKGDEATRWATYAGSYGRRVWGYLDPSAPSARFVVDAGVPYFASKDPETDSLVRHRLAEIAPGLFLADNGETLDLRRGVPTWRNLPLVRVSGGPATWQWAILGVAALVAFTWLGAALVRSIRRSSGSGSSSRRRRRWRRLTALVASTTALLTLATAALFAWMPGLVDSGFLGGYDLSAAEGLAVHLPLAVAVVGASMAVLAATGGIGRWWTRAVTVQYAALAVAAIALVPLLAGWHLLG